MSTRHNILRLSCAPLALIAGLLAPVPAQAQTPAPPAAAQPEGEAIIVTGSRIRRSPLEQAAPIVFLDSQEIAKTGLSSVNDVLQRLPSSGGGANSKFNNSGNLGNPPDGGGVGAGAAEIDLRYLGSRRVLVLVDGIRFVLGASASGVPGSTDLNSIPESAIERIEVLQDGASAIYGSDAIAGVVNIITKKRQAGIEGIAQIGVFDEGDGATQNYQLSWGNGGDSPLQIVVGGNYVKQDSISAGDRAISRFPAPYATSCAAGGCSTFLPNGRYSIFGAGAGNRLDLTLNAPVIGRPSTPADFRALQDTDRFNFAPFNFIQIPLERYGVFGNVRYEFSDAVNLSLKGIWNKRKSKNQAAPLPFGIGPAAGITPVLDATTVDATNPFNPFGVTLDASNLDFILRRFVEGGPRRFQQDVETIYGVATLDGRFEIGGRDWYWDINGVYGRNKAEQQMFGNINSGLLRQALGPIADCTSPCVPFNLFGGAGSITPEMINFVSFVQNDSSKQTTWDATANISGELFDLPGGALGLAAGVEYRKLKGRFDPDPIVAAGFSSDIPAQPTRGSYDVKEAYAEIRAPLLADIPFVHLLELNGAVRVSDYSTSGSTTTFKGGVNWMPISDLRLRASYAEGFRAPSIGELFGTQSRFDQTLDDPCSSHAGNTAPRRFQNDATVRENCIAAGVPASGVYQQANPQISVLVGGNENLAPETSKSWIFGGVYSPSFLRGFSVEANYYDIKIDGAIQAVDAEVTVTNCVVTNDPVACALVTRAGAQLTQVVGLLQNIAGIKTRGIDLNVAYRTGETGFGRFGFTWNNTFLRKFDETVPGPSGEQVLRRAGTERGSPAQGFPKWKAIGIIDWDMSTFGATLTGRYISKLKEGLPGDLDRNVLNSRFYTDVQLRFTLPEAQEFGFAVGVNNLFDKDPPACLGCDLNNFDPTMYDVPGRFFYARANIKM